jgi:thiosulfate dehydrogenase (quinone) large subunit
MLRAMQKYRWQGWALFAMRVGMGLFFLNEAFTQLRKGWLGGDGLERFLQARIDNGSVPGFYEPFLTDVVIANAGLFTPIVLLGEVGMGVALILGLLTRVTALNGIFMNANFLIMNDKNLGAAGVDALFIVAQIVLFAFAARQALSVDEKLIERGLPLPLGPKRMQPVEATI